MIYDQIESRVQTYYQMAQLISHVPHLFTRLVRTGKNPGSSFYFGH